MRACPFCPWLRPLGLGLSLALAAAPAAAHENEVNRATLVLREKGHLSLTLFIHYPEALHQALAPRSSFRDFAMSHAAMDAGRFEAALRKAQTGFQAGIRLARQDGGVLAPTRWQWPAAAQVQRLLRERAMALMVGGHAHAAQQEIGAEFQSDRPVAKLAAHFPPAFGPVLVVSYRPEQTMVDGKSAPLIRFPPPG